MQSSAFFCKLKVFFLGFWSGKRKEPKPKLFVLDIFGWGGGLPREGVGAKKFGVSFETRETKLFHRISRDIAGISRGHPKSLRKKSLCSILVPHFGPPKSPKITRNCWKSKFLYRYRPEGIFSNFFGLILDPPRYICFYSEKRQIHLYRPFFFPLYGLFRKKGGDWYRYTFFFSLKLPKIVWNRLRRAQANCLTFPEKAPTRYTKRAGCLHT